MSSRENRKSLNVLNDTLRADNMTLKNHHSQLLSHIQTLIRRQKQLSKLKQQLEDQLVKSQQIAMRQKVLKQDKCFKLEIELNQMGKELKTIDLTLKNLQEEYQVCLNDYDKILAEISSIIQNNKIIQLQIAQQKQKHTTINAMIFDFQRLQRVLQQQRKYFKQLSKTQQTSHISRMKQFQQIRSKLIKQQKQYSQKSFTDKIKIGLIKLNNVYRKKYQQYLQLFFRGNYKFQKVTDLGIMKFKNCLEIGTSKYNKQIRRVFYSWHHNVFPKDKLNNLVQNSLKMNIQSKTKIKVLNKIVQRLNADNLNLLHLYERTKVVCITANAIKRKQIHFAFSRWRQNSSYLTKIKYRLQRLPSVISLVYKRSIFQQLKRSIHFKKRFQMANHLFSQYEDSKGMAWALRRWRLQVKNRDVQIIQRYIQNIKRCNMIQQRVKYEKRKVKALTNLQLCMSKIQLRNYFSRYYQNVKKQKIAVIENDIENVREKCVQQRKINKNARLVYKDKYLNLSLNILSETISKAILNIGFQELKRIYQKDEARRQALMLVILKKQGKNKYYVMNQFRKNVQYYQKKQMHQVLTDLNRKMQQINEKSTKFRQALQKTIEQLGIQSSKKIDQVGQYALNCQKKVFFNWHSRMSIKKKYKYFLVARTLQIFTHFSYKNMLRTLQTYCIDDKKQKLLQQRQKIFNKHKSQRLVKRSFYGLLKQLKLHKLVFSKFIHVQNVLYFYRLEYAMIAIMKRSHEQELKVQQKQVDDLNKNLKNKKENLLSLKNDKKSLEQKLKSLFAKFINFQEISQKNKLKNFYEDQKRKYFNIYRKNVRNKQYGNKVLTNFTRLLQYKNYFIFWKSILLINQQSKQALLKDQLGKINKKIKNFQQKTSKTKYDIQRKLSQQQKIHEQKQTQSKYYLQKYTGILKYYDKNHQNLQKQRYYRSIFYAWKRQYLGAKKFGSAIYNILRRTQLIDPYRLLFEQFKNYDSKFRSQMLCASILQRKHKKLLVDGFNYWRYNMRHGYTDSIRYKVDHIDQHHQEIKNGVYSKGELYANQILRNIKFNLKSKVFMGFKNNWINQKQTQKKINPLLKKTQHRRVFEAMRNWKWLMFYKRTKRSFLQYKKQKSQIQLKRDVFNSLKIHRMQIYNIVQLTDNLCQNRLHYLKRFAMSKIINVGCHEKNQLNHARRRALHTLLMNKITRQKTIKRTVMWKWQSQLIPRKHYLCNILKSIELRILKSAFANINQKKYWNQYYIKDIAQKVTTEGYSDVNSVTNILVREGFDPDQLKDYLKIKNQKDNRVIKQVVGHLKCYPQKQKMIQAFHSWKEYVSIRKNIKRALTKVFNFSTGLGRYFDKWRKKDPAFNQILQKQSRINMLERYKQLERLMKQYRRDIKDSIQNVEQLRVINDEHAKATKMTVQMAFSNVATSVHKGMRQGFQIWRLKAKQEKTLQRNQRYDQLVDGIQMLDDQKRKIKQKIQRLHEQNYQLKQKCKFGEQCGYLLKKLMSQKDGLTIDLAQKQHNLKILLQDNLRLKQKIKIAKQTAMKLINKVRDQQIVVQGQ